MIPIPRRDTAADRLALIRDLLTNLPAAVAYLAGPELIIDFANDAYRRLVGDRDVVGTPLRQALPELTGQGRLELLERIMETGESVWGTETGVLVQRRGEQAEQLFVDFVYQPVRDADGAIVGVLLYAADVTEHVRDRDRLEALARHLAASEERYRTLFETMPQGVIHYDADGSIIGVNPAASEILGMDLTAATSWPVVPEGQSVREDGSPFPLEDLPVRVALRTGDTVADVVLGFTHAATGELRWLRVTAIPDARDDQGRPSRAYAIFTDLTEQRRTEAALQESTALLGRLRDANVLGVAVSTEQGVYEANDAFLNVIGYSSEDLAAGRVHHRSITAPQWADRDRAAMEQLRRTGAVRPFDKEYVHRDGHRVPVVIGAAVIDRNPLRWVTFIIDLTARQRAERERAELIAGERAARAEAGTARERLTFLMRAGGLVAAARDWDKLLDEVAQLVVPSLADCCVVFLPTADGKLCASALTHADPARAKLLTRLREYPIPRVGPLISQRSYTTGTTTLIRHVPTEMPGWLKAEPDLMSIVTLMNPESAIGTPLLAGQGVLGVMVLGRGAERPRFAPTDVEVIEELSRRLAVGLANADTFAREHAIAETLQRSLLPDTLPPIPGVDLAVRYLPATEGANVGGDWYDAFPLRDGRVGLVTGDVAGHNIASASIMGQARSLLRGYAIDNPDPGYVLRRTNAAVAQLLPDVLASAVYAVLDPATGDLAYASAGHPPPLVTTGTGQAEYLDDTVGVMLGACADASYTTRHRQLQPGAGLLCYTDGLIEDRHRDISDGLAVLAETLQRSGPSSAEQTCATVQAALLGAAGRDDDVCLLAARLTG
ncbi:MAG TPA: SpoIIE family protein phosphatase [Streptosporangiaceae bacterium]|nr:SpoIIE family protein phosphatase [Streptosporangiaceae bacterium]